MKNFKIEIPKGYEIDKEESTFENIVFKKSEKYYPQSIEEVSGRHYYLDPVNFSTEERAKAFLALMQLVELRDAYNKIDGRKDFMYGGDNYCICSHEEGLETRNFSDRKCVLHFEYGDTRNLFFKNFRDLIIQARELI